MNRIVPLENVVMPLDELMLTNEELFHIKGGMYMGSNYGCDCNCGGCPGNKGCDFGCSGDQ